MHLYGKNSVLERLRANPKSVKGIFLDSDFKNTEILDGAHSAGIPVKHVTPKELLRIKKADRLQGIVARVEDFRYTPPEEALQGFKERGLSLLFLDGLNDPHNLGSVLRIAACFGGFSVIIPKHGSCEVNDTVMHVASGGENFVPVSLVTNLTNAVLKAKKAGYWIVGTVVDGGEDINRVSLPFPLGIVLGSEGKGIRPSLRKHLDLKLSLPMSGASLSLNVAMAAAIFCYEAARQKQKKGEV